MELVIKDGVVVTPSGMLDVDILCTDGHIERLAARGTLKGRGDYCVDAKDKLVFPGFIDPHVHSRDPGATESEDFAHSTRAAAAGGLTTILEMPNAVPPVTDAAILRARAELHSQSAFVDFGLWGLALGAANLSDVSAMFDAGAVGVKLFWGYALNKKTKQLVYNAGDVDAAEVIPPPSNGEVYALMEEVARTGGLLAAHCEDRAVIDTLDRAYGPMQTYDDILAIHSDVAESVSVAIAAEMARSTGCRFHVLHLSSARALEIVERARKMGVKMSAETCAHYLTLTDTDFERIGPIMKVYPPVRGVDDRTALMAGVRSGVIDSLGSDHAPHTLDAKMQGLAKAPAGGVGVETLVPVILNEMAMGRLSPTVVARVLSESTAKMYGLFPRKGSVVPGSDADFTVVDPRNERVIKPEMLHSRQKQSPWAGQTLRSQAVLGILRGNIIMDNGEPTGERLGEFVPAQHCRPQEVDGYR